MADGWVVHLYSILVRYSVPGNIDNLQLAIVAQRIYGVKCPLRYPLKGTDLCDDR